MQEFPRHCLVSKSFFAEITDVKVVCFCMCIYLSITFTSLFIFNIIELTIHFHVSKFKRYKIGEK